MHNTKLPLYFLSLILLALTDTQKSLLNPEFYIFFFIAYGLSWKFIFKNQDKSSASIFIQSTSFFLGIQLIQLFWLTGHEHAGYSLYFVHPFISLLIAFQFGLFTFFVNHTIKKNSLYIHLLPSLWVLFEWSRIYWLSGLTWNPIGLPLIEDTFASQLASIGGIFFLSYWVIWANLVALKMFLSRTKSSFLQFALILIFPFLFGMIQLSIIPKTKPNNQLIVGIIDSQFDVEDKYPLTEDWQQRLIHPLDQWKSSLSILRQVPSSTLNFIVFPEGFFSFSIDAPLFHLEDVQHIFFHTFGVKIANSKDQVVSHRFIAQTLAHLLQTELIIGFEGEDHTNSAFHFLKDGSSDPIHYAKQVLVPMGEYIPLQYEWVKKIAATHGVYDSFVAGNKTVVFDTEKAKVGVTICYEETFGDIVRKNRLFGADLIVNLTNDAWFPNSDLPQQHLLHAQGRPIENGCPLIRSCNKGISTAFDSLGRELPITWSHWDPIFGKQRLGIAYIDLANHRTVYTYWGDQPLIIWCFLATFLIFWRILSQNFSRFRFSFLK